jgi:hypothetical protein
LIGDLLDDLGLNGLDEMCLLPHWNQKGSRAADDTVAEVEVQVLVSQGLSSRFSMIGKPLMVMP